MIRAQNVPELMKPHLTEQWAQVQKDLGQKVAEAERKGTCLIELGMRLKQEPWRWAIGWLGTAFPNANETCLLESEIEEALDKHRLMWLLDDIRILRRREAELKKLIAA